MYTLLTRKWFVGVCRYETFLVCAVGRVPCSGHGLTGCAPSKRVEILPGPSPTPGGLNIAQAQQALPSASPSQQPSAPAEASQEPQESEENAGRPTPPPPVTEDSKIVYLTFDDGPSKNTEALLEVLAGKAGARHLLHPGHQRRRPPRAGGGHRRSRATWWPNHTYSHQTDEIYQSADALLADIEKCAETIRSILGEEYPTDLFRFPYGSTNKACRDYRQAVREAGYRYFDWNALNGDAETGTYKRTPEELLERFKQTVDDVDGRKNEVIVLMHETGSKENTVKMLGDAIDYLKELGYEFRTLEYAQMKD